MISPVNTSIVPTAFVRRSNSVKSTFEPFFLLSLLLSFGGGNLDEEDCCCCTSPTTVVVGTMPANLNIDFNTYVVSSGDVIHIHGHVCRAA